MMIMAGGEVVSLAVRLLPQPQSLSLLLLGQRIHGGVDGGSAGGSGRHAATFLRCALSVA